MSHIMSTVGFLSHPSFTSTRVKEQLSGSYDEDALEAQAASHFEEEHDSAVHTAGKDPADCPFDPTKFKEQITARARMKRHEAEAILDSTTWCLRDALASVCVHMQPRGPDEGECNFITCRFANAPRGARMIRPGTRREMYKCHRGQLHSYMTSDVKQAQLRAERRQAKLAMRLPRPPLELLRSAQNTLELEQLQDGEITATDTQIAFLDMPQDDWSILYTSRAWLKSTVGHATMDSMRRQIPLWKFFNLFPRMLASPWEVEACATYFPAAQKSRAFSYTAAPSFLGMNFLRDHAGYRSLFDLTTPKSVWEQVLKNEKQLKLLKGRSVLTIAAS